MYFQDGNSCGTRITIQMQLLKNRNYDLELTACTHIKICTKHKHTHTYTHKNMYVFTNIYTFFVYIYCSFLPDGNSGNLDTKSFKVT